MRHIFFRIFQLSKRKRYTFYIIIVILVAVFLDKVVFQAVMGRMDELNSAILVQERKMQKTLGILSMEDLITEEYAKCIEGVGRKYSEEEEKSKLLSEIERLARSSLVSLKNIKPGAIKKIGPYEEYTIKIEVEAKMNYLVDFIYKLERSPCLLRVESFQLRTKDKKSPILRGQMTITEILIGKK